MIATRSTDLNQGFGPVPAIGQDIDLTRDGQCKGFDDLLSQGNFGVKGAAPPRSLRMIQFGPQREKKLFTEQGREDPLMAKDVGHVLSMILMPTTTGNLLAGLLSQRVIHDKKQDIPGGNPQGLKELIQGDLQCLFDSPNVFSEEARETAERSVQERTSQGLHHGGRMSFFAQLDKTDDKAREDSERRS